MNDGKKVRSYKTNLDIANTLEFLNVILVIKILWRNHHDTFK